MSKDFSLHKYFKNQYLDEAKSTSELETDAMRSPDFEMYNKKDGEQSYISNDDLQEFQQPKSFDPDTIRLVREMLEAADIYHNDLVGGDGEVSSFLDKRSGGTYFKFPHFNGGPGMFGKSTVDRIDFSKAEAKEAALKTYTQFKEYIEDYEISDASPTGVYGNVYLFVMFNDSAEDYSAPKGGTQSSQFENINDPVLMRARAAREKQPEPSRGGLDLDDILDLRGEKKDLELRINNLYREMENDPDVEGEGGAVADQYGDELNRLETRLYKVKKQINQYDMNEGSCGYTPDGKPRNKPASSNLMGLKEKIFNSLKK